MPKHTHNMIKQERFIAIARNTEPSDILDIAEALYEGNVKLIEITFPQHLPDNIEITRKAISKLCKHMGNKMSVGAGTVLNINQLHAAFDAGAEYIVSPNANPEIIKETKRLGLVSIPGAMTPTEICYAYEYGADIVKLFPADDLGYHYIRNILMPLSHIPICATGGVNPDTIPKFFECGVKCVGAGISIMKPELIKEKNFKEISRLAKLHIEAVRSCKKGVL